jgi:hypothetical protein
MPRDHFPIVHLLGACALTGCTRGPCDAVVFGERRF